MKPRAPNRTRASSMHCLVALGLAIAGPSACGNDAQRVRIEILEQDLQRLDTRLAALEKAAATKPAAPEPTQPEKPPEHPIKLTCPAPFALDNPLGAALWTCRASTPTAEGMLPQCNVVFQPQVAIDVKDYFDFTLNNTPQLFSAMNYERKNITLRNQPGWEATFEAQLSPVPLKAIGVLMPHTVNTYVVTCFAPKRTFTDYEPTFRKIIDSFELKPK